MDANIDIHIEKLLPLLWFTVLKRGPGLGFVSTGTVFAFWYYSPTL